MSKPVAPIPPKGPDTPEELAALVYGVYQSALKAGDNASALRSLRTLGELAGFIGSEPRRRAKGEKATALDAEIKSLEARLGLGSES